MKRFFILLPLSLTLTGCTGINGTIKALSKDPATVSASITTPWGSGKFVRIGGQTNGHTVTVSPDGSVTTAPPPVQ